MRSDLHLSMMQRSFQVYSWMAELSRRIRFMKSRDRFRCNGILLDDSCAPYLIEMICNGQRSDLWGRENEMIHSSERNPFRLSGKNSSVSLPNIRLGEDFDTWEKQVVRQGCWFLFEKRPPAATIFYLIYFDLHDIITTNSISALVVNQFVSREEWWNCKIFICSRYSLCLALQSTRSRSKSCMTSDCFKSYGVWTRRPFKAISSIAHWSLWAHNDDLCVAMSSIS